ncbi:MAG: cobalt ECF transporter T component CbiQ [Chloroflexi bacterium]|nr:cobalt ECF transporter T component CbiQ [Chloroflexota bacterium]
MHVHFLDPYRPLVSPIHALDGRVKFVLTVAFILTVSLTPYGAWPVYLLLLSLMISVEILSGLGVGFVLRRANLALPFVLAALPLVFTTPGRELARLPIGPWTLVATVEGMLHFINVALKSWLSVQAAIVLASSTPFPDLLLAMRAVRIPRLLVAMFGLMWRYLFVLADEGLRLMRARASRSGHARRVDGEARRARAGGSLGWRARVTGGMAGSLFLRAIERSDRIYVAMLSRGYDGEVRSFALPPLSLRAQSTLWIGLSVLGILWLTGLLAWG